MKLVRLHEWRRRRGLSQQELSERSEVERAMISKYENGRRDAHPQTARRLAEALSVGVEDLLFSPDAERPAWGKPTGAALDAAREEGREAELLERYAAEVGEGPGRYMYQTYAREAEFLQALRERDLSQMPAKSGASLRAYMELVGGFVEAGVKIPAGLARSVAEVLAREGKEEKDGGR